MSPDKMNRFYKDVSIVPGEEGLAVALDGRVAKTAGRLPLASAEPALAEAIAQEWRDQETVIDLTAMPLTRLQGFVLDGGEKGGAEWRSLVVRFAGSDLLCYRAEDGELARRQAAQWQPILDQVGTALGGEFAVTAGIIAVEQPGAVLSAIEDWLGGLSLSEVLAAKLMTEITGSAVLAAGVVMGCVTSEQALVASRLDETYQEEQWGQDAEAMERAALISEEFHTVARFMALSRGG